MKATLQPNSPSIDSFFMRAARSARPAVCSAVLGAVVFTGGVGEHQPLVRRQIAAAFEVCKSMTRTLASKRSRSRPPAAVSARGWFTRAKIWSCCAKRCGSVPSSRPAIDGF